MKSKWRISFSFIVVIIAALSFWNYNNRIYDWDMPGYIGCLYTLKYPDSPDKIRRLTYEEIRKKAPAYEFKDIIGTLKPANKARQAFANNTQAFIEQLPYFQIKVGYNLAILLLYEIGFSSPDSVTLLSVFSYFISGIMIFLILKIIFPENYILTVILTVGLLLLPPMMYMARVATPDMFIVQILLLFVIGLLKKWNSWPMFSVLFAITFTRPDYIPFTLTYLATAGIYKYSQSKKIDFILVLQGILLLVLYFIIIKLCHYPGWKHLFYDTFIHRRSFISAPPPNFGLNEYLRIIYIKIIYFKRVTVVSLGLLCFTFYCSKNLWTRICSVLIFANIYIKFFFFPHSSSLRFFFPYILMLLMIALYALSKKYNGFKLRKIA